MANLSDIFMTNTLAPISVTHAATWRIASQWTSKNHSRLMPQ